MARQLVFSRFERLWHWAQALLIVALMVTGFEIHGSYAMLGYKEAADWHQVAAWTLIGLWAFAIFWHITTGEWRQYIPTTDRLMAVVKYYTVGIFHPNVPHPFHKTRLVKHNPLQRLAYLFFKLVISPIIWVSGLLYLFYNDWPSVGLGGFDLGIVAAIHLAAAFLMLVFFIGHVYMSVFTAKPLTAYLKAMITGWEDVNDQTKA